MKIATYNVNGFNGRLPVLLNCLANTKPDVACLQELKAPDEKFPVGAIREAGYEAISHGQKSWNGVAILARNEKPTETRRGLPGDPDDTHSRYIEADIGGVTSSHRMMRCSHCVLRNGVAPRHVPTGTLPPATRPVCSTHPQHIVSSQILARCRLHSRYVAETIATSTTEIGPL